MGQQESSYRKFDRSSRRKKIRVANGDNENSEGERRTKDTKQFSLASVNWRPSGSGASSLTDKLPGWYHGWTNKLQVKP